MAIFAFSCSSPKPPQNPNTETLKSNSSSIVRSNKLYSVFRRDLSLRVVSAFSILALRPALRLSSDPSAFAESAPPKPAFGGIASTRSWFQYFGDGFSIRIPPQFEDVMEPEEYNTGFSFYGDKAKSKVYAARFASPDGSEVVSVVIRPSNQLKITFLEEHLEARLTHSKTMDKPIFTYTINEDKLLPTNINCEDLWVDKFSKCDLVTWQAKDIKDLGSLKEASKIFVPGGATLYSARTIKIKEAEDLRTYYFYEFGIDNQHAALVATVDGGKAYISAAAAPEPKWGEDGVKLRSAAISLAVL